MEQYSREEILNIVEEEDVEFIRLQFTDMFGTMKNIAIPAGKLPDEGWGGGAHQPWLLPRRAGTVP